MTTPPTGLLSPPKLLLGLVCASVVAHAGLAVVGGALWAQVMSAVLALAALAIVALLLQRPVPHTVLATALYGMVGVASFLAVLGAALAAGGSPVAGWVGPWGIAAVIVDSSAVRISAAVLRRAEREQQSRGPAT
ncbi:hypothetical protein [Pseudonocardia ailaonensis]|uniref:hypothetical protein n=1 Tax=Pseudonocardia ailaonensis TaxID=367279 RepID=UPI0031DA9953